MPLQSILLKYLYKYFYEHHFVLCVLFSQNVHLNIVWVCALNNIHSTQNIVCSPPVIAMYWHGWKVYITLASRWLRYTSVKRTHGSGTKGCSIEVSEKEHFHFVYRDIIDFTSTKCWFILAGYIFWLRPVWLCNIAYLLIFLALLMFLFFVVIYTFTSHSNISYFGR